MTIDWIIRPYDLHWHRRMAGAEHVAMAAACSGDPVDFSEVAPAPAAVVRGFDLHLHGKHQAALAAFQPARHDRRWRASALAGISRAAHSLGAHSFETDALEELSTLGPVPYAFAQHRLSYLMGIDSVEEHFESADCERGVWGVRTANALRLVNQNEFTAVLERGREIIAVPHALIDPYQMSQLIHAVSISLRNTGDLEQALVWATRAAALLGDLTCPSRRVSIFNNLASILAKLGRLAEARAAFDIALASTESADRKLIVLSNVVSFDLADVVPYGFYLLSQGGASGQFVKACQSRNQQVRVDPTVPQLSTPKERDRLLWSLKIRPPADDRTVDRFLHDHIFDRFKLCEFQTFMGLKYGTAKLRLVQLRESGAVAMIGTRKAAQYAPDYHWAL